MAIGVRNPKDDMPTDERRRLMLQNPQIYQKVMELADTLVRNAGPQIEVLVDMPIGAKFRDVETGTKYVYEAIATPFKHGDLINLICTAARQDLEELQGMTYFIIREHIPPTPIIVGEAPSPFMPPMTPLKVINGRDFVKYFVIGKWVLIDKPSKTNPDDFAGEEGVLSRTE